jgi:PIN domain nuclease of toxin-antitoxin system
MNLLLDTHTFLWFITSDSRLSATAQTLISTTTNQRFLSIASLWEMAIKISLGKLNLAEPFSELFPRQLRLNRIDVLDIRFEHVAAVVAMPFHHRDPFDRLMAAQCRVENLPIVSFDSNFDAYSVQRRW